MQRKLDWLALDPEKPDSYGNVYINMKFDDGTVAYKAGKPGDMTQHYADLLGIQKSGELVEIELEDTGKTTAKGAKKWKLVGYPGWSAPVAQGGKAQANAGNSRSTDESIARAVALKAAVQYFDKNMDDEDVLDMANRFYAWLQREEGQQDAMDPTPERPSDPIPAPTSEGSRSSGTGTAGSPARSRASEESSVAVTGKDPADTSEGGGGSSGPRGSDGSSSPADNDLWAGVDVS
jgi:hypothetical protein